MKYAICNETYGQLSFEAVCDDVASCGYDGIEIAPFTLAEDPHTLTEKDGQRIAAVAQRAGLEVVGFHWLLTKPAGLSITSDDAALRERTCQFAEHLARLCGAMGGKVMVWGSPKQRWIDQNQPRERAYEHAREVIRRVCDVAGPLGVAVAMEPLSTKEANFLTTAAETIAFIRDVDHPACRLLLDVKAMSDEALAMDQIIRDSAAHLSHFHANDANLRGPGFGDVDFTPIAAALHDIDYQGYVSVEVFDYSPDAHTIARQSLDYLRRVFEGERSTRH